jgi:hypothetical protein
MVQEHICTLENNLMTFVQTLHHISILVPTAISMFYSRKPSNVYHNEASLLQS